MSFVPAASSICGFLIYEYMYGQDSFLPCLLYEQLFRFFYIFECIRMSSIAVTPSLFLIS